MKFGSVRGDASVDALSLLDGGVFEPGAALLERQINVRLHCSHGIVSEHSLEEGRTLNCEPRGQVGIAAFIDRALRLCDRDWRHCGHFVRDRTRAAERVIDDFVHQSETKRLVGCDNATA